MWKIEDLEKIQKLRDKGILTEEEFENEKSKILGVDISDMKVEEPQKESSNQNNQGVKEVIEEIKQEPSKKETINKKVKPKICRNCGNHIDEGEKFCGKCGKKIKTTKTIIIRLVIAIIVIAFIITIYNANKKIEVPDLVGMTVAEAQEITDKLGLTLRVTSLR